MLLHPLPWPDGKRLAASITFDIDADSLIRNARPEDGHLRLAPVSMGRYGPTVAVPRILDTYRRLGLRQTFFMPAWVMETYPATVETILEDGHEIGHHSWRHEDPMGTFGRTRGGAVPPRARHPCPHDRPQAARLPRAGLQRHARR